MIYNLVEEYNNITLRWSSSLNSTYCMFNGVANITFFDLSNFDSSKLMNTYCMFSNIKLLTSLDLSKLDTSQVTDFRGMFIKSSALISLDLSNFNTSKAIYMNGMFNGCESLKYLNLKSFTEERLSDLDGMFQRIPSSLIYCIDESKAPNIASALKLKSINNNCFHNCFLKSTILLIDNCISCYNISILFPYKYKDECLDKCPKKTKPYLYDNYDYICQDLNCTYFNYNQTDCIDEIPEGYYLNDSYLKTIDKCNYECKTCINNSSNCLTCRNDLFFDSGKCVSECINGYYKDSNNNKICKCSFNIKCKECITENIPSNDLCISCNNDEGYYPIRNNNLIDNDNDTFIACYKRPEGFYLDLDNKIYKPCYNKCKSCLIGGTETNNNCQECKDNYELLKDIHNNTNCYKKCNDYYYFDLSNTYNCTEGKVCPYEYKLIKDKNQCIYKCNMDNLYQFEFGNICYEKCPPGTKISSFDINICEKENLQYQSNKEIEYTTNKFNATNFFNDIYKINNADSFIKTIRNEILNGNMDELLENVINGEKKDLIEIQENIIYTITTSDNQINNKNENVSTINLGECEHNLKQQYNISPNETLIIFKIDFLEKASEIPIVEYEIFHPKTKQQLDMIYCKDIKIKINTPVKIDEKNEFKYNPLSDYYKDVCFTYTSENGTDISLKDRKNEFLNKNMSLCEPNCDYKEYYSDAKKVSCECELKIKIPLISEIVINKDILKNKFVDVKKLMNLNVMKCYNVLFTSKGLTSNIGFYIILIIILINIILLFIFIIKGYKYLYNQIYKIKENCNNSNNIEIIGNDIIQITENMKNKINKKRKKKKNKANKSTKLNLINSKNLTNVDKSKNINISILNTNNHKKEIINENLKKKEIYNDFEYNTLSYDEALKKDKRTYLQYYLSLLKMKYLLIFTFFTNDDYNSKSIKIALLLFNFALYLTINALFFNDTTMHKILEDGGAFNIIYQIPQILYSALITSIINLIITYFSLTERSIISLKKQKNNIKVKIENLINCLKIKFFIFFIVKFSLLLFFWYYLSCFCAVYENTQIHLIKDTLFSLLFSFLYPLIIYLIPGIFRIISLKEKNANKECLYKLSKIIQLI